MLQAKQMFEACEVKKNLSNLQNIINQARAQRSGFGQHDFLSIRHNVGLELTLSFSLGPVPWSLSTPDRIPTKTDKSKLLHELQSHIELTLDWPCGAGNNFNNPTEHNSFSCHLQGSHGNNIQPGTKDRTCWFCH